MKSSSCNKDETADAHFTVCSVELLELFYSFSHFMLIPNNFGCSWGASNSWFVSPGP